jgi:hypothetical protein
MSQDFDFSNILLIIAGIMLATTLFVVLLVFFARLFDWSISLSERLSSLLISCEHCGAPLSFKGGKNCKSCGKPISQILLKKYKLRIWAVSCLELSFLVLIMGNILFASIPFILGLVLGGYERYYTRIMRDSKGSDEKA